MRLPEMIHRRAPRVRRLSIDAIGLILLLSCLGCSLVDRAGRDLETAGGNIRKSADWVGSQLGYPTEAPPVVSGSSSVTRYVVAPPPGADAPPADLPAEPCSWTNAKPNC